MHKSLNTRSLKLEEREVEKLIKQACDRWWTLILKSFVPLYHFRYWNTRFWVGAVAWIFLLSMGASGVESRTYQIRCRPDETSCLQRKQALLYGYFAVLFSANIVFGLYGGSKANKARQRLGLSRNEALLLIKEKQDEAKK